MKFLLKQIKSIVTAAIPSLSGRIFMNVVSNKTNISDGPYCRVVYVGQDETQYSFSDFVGYDETTIQFSIFAESLTAADGLVDQIITALNGVVITLDVGGTAVGCKRKRGILTEPKSTNANQVFHCWTTVEFCHQDQLS